MRDTTYSLSPFSPKISFRAVKSPYSVPKNHEEYIEYITNVVVITLKQTKWAMVSWKFKIYRC